MASQKASSPPRETHDPPATTETQASSSTLEPVTAAAGVWQAIYSPQHNAYYFYNSETQETTWANPLQPANAADGAQPSTSATPGLDDTSTASASHHNALEAAAEAAGIDPSLAYLDPTLASVPGASSGAYTYTAKFNARTGAFAKVDSRDPTHLSEYERAKRMSEFYFDVGAWEREVEERKMMEQAEEAEGSARKKRKPTKKDLVSNYVSLAISCYFN